MGKTFRDTEVDEYYENQVDFTRENRARFLPERRRGRRYVFSG
jgi:hypothetical protein